MRALIWLGIVCAVVTGSSVASSAEPARRNLRVCADPNDLPLSNLRRQGFENELASLLAKDLNAELSFVWWPQRRGFLRHTLNAGRCDLVMGLPAGFERVLTTRPVYRSTYVLVLGPKAPLIRSLDDPRLRLLRIGVPVVGDDGADPPPVAALVRRHMTANVRGYPVYGDYSSDEPAGEIVRAVSRGEVDVAIAWGPLASYYAHRSTPRLRVVPLSAADAPADLGFSFAMALAVRKGDDALLAELNAALERKRHDIEQLLKRFHVPLV
jgi:mxaJ protein